MVIPERRYVGNAYKYRFNGKENDNEAEGSGNQQDYGMRIYEPRIGRFLSLDPLTRKYAWNSPYSFAEEDVLRCVDLDGLEKYLIIYEPVGNTGLAKVTITVVEDIKKKTYENMMIAFTDGSQNDPSQNVLRIKNGFAIYPAKKQTSKDQHNTQFITGQESRIVKAGFQPVNNQDNVVTVKSGEKTVGESKEFDPKDFEKQQGEAFVGGISFNAGALQTYSETIGTLLKKVKAATGNKKLRTMYIDISHDDKLDKEVTDEYTKRLKIQFGDKLEINWIQTPVDHKISKDSNGQQNANVTITAIK